MSYPRFAPYLTADAMTDDESARVTAILADYKRRGLTEIVKGPAALEGVRRRVKRDPDAGRELLPPCFRAKDGSTPPPRELSEAEIGRLARRDREDPRTQRVADRLRAKDAGRHRPDEV